MVDINTAFDRPTAIRFGRRIAEYDITWYEEPLSPMDLDGLAVVRASTGIPIATGENEYTRWGFREMFTKGGVDVAIPDMARTGGITEMKKICAVAEAFGVVVSPHNYSSGVCSAATLHLMAATPGTGPLEWDTVGSSIVPDLFIEPPVLRDGHIVVPAVAGPGRPPARRGPRPIRHVACCERVLEEEPNPNLPTPRQAAILRPPSSRHRADRVRDVVNPHTRYNTVAMPWVDFDSDVAAIRAGRAVRDGNRFVVNGREYVLEGDGSSTPPLEQVSIGLGEAHTERSPGTMSRE